MKRIEAARDELVTIVMRWAFGPISELPRNELLDACSALWLAERLAGLEPWNKWNGPAVAKLNRRKGKK